jgi:hypothetical protein
MIRRCVDKFLLVLLIVIEKRSQKITAAAITMPKSECRRNVKCPKFQLGHATPVRAIAFGGQGTARPTCAAWRCRGGCINRLNFVGRLCQTPTIWARRFRTEPRGRKRPRRAGRRPSEREPTSQRPYNLFQPYGAMRSVSVSV